MKPGMPDDKAALQSNRELEAIRRLSQTLFQHTTVEQLVETALRCALEEVGAEAGSVLLADPKTKQLVFQYSIGDNPVPRGTAMPWDKGIAGEVFQSGEPVIASDVKKSGHHFGEVLSGFVTRDMITLPLKRWEGEPVGVMNVLNKRKGTLDENDLALLTIIAAFAAIAIEQARLFEEAKLAEVVHRLGDIGHDLKNLQTPVVMGTGLLRDEIKDLYGLLAADAGPQGGAHYQTCEELIEMVREGAHRTQDRVKEIADCVKGLSSPPNFQACRISAVVESVLKTLRVMAEDRGLTLKTNGIETLPPIVADERRLFNALYNLVNNAIPEVPAGGSITISGQASDGFIILSVADTGRGMPPEIRESLFSSHAISSKPGGTGLGTKIVKDVVDAHGGKIWVESTVGVGTTFHIRLPISQPAT